LCYVSFFYKQEGGVTHSVHFKCAARTQFYWH